MNLADFEPPNSATPTPIEPARWMRRALLSLALSEKSPAKGVNKINEAMKKLYGAARESSAASTELAATSDEFNKMVKKIESQVSKFKSE